MKSQASGEKWCFICWVGLDDCDWLVSLLAFSCSFLARNLASRWALLRASIRLVQMFEPAFAILCEFLVRLGRVVSGIPIISGLHEV